MYALRSPHLRLVLLENNNVIKRCNRSKRTHISCASQQDAPSWLEQNADTVRIAPLIAGAGGIAGVLLNRVISGVAPVVLASSSQSRADVLVIIMSAILALTGLNWLSLKPKTPERVDVGGVEAAYLDSSLPPDAQKELLWAWQAATAATSAQMMVVLHKGKCVMHYGLAANKDIIGKQIPGEMCNESMQNNTGKYLANLQLFPGRFEILSYLPPRTQSAIIQPIGDEGVMILGGPYIRGFSRLDQAWIATLCDKLNVVLDES